MKEFLAYGHGGLVVAAVALVALLVFGSGKLAPGRASTRRARSRTIAAAAVCAAVPLLAELGLSTWYLFSPTYIDHIEASVASLTHYFMAGLPVYPDLGTGYTFHGLLYGPLLPELNSVGYAVAGGATASKLVGWAAAWLAVILMVLVTPRARRDWAWTVSFIVFCCTLLSFGNMLTADRADPLLLLFATVALLSAVRLSGPAGLLIPALLAGLAAGLKLHGPVYMLPALACWTTQHLGERSRGRAAATLAAAAAVALIGLVIPFLPANVCVSAYLSYLKLGARHGLSLPLFAWNAAFVAALWVPALLTRRLATQALFAGCLAVAELLVLIVASKPGAGIHHLLPFVCYHCFLLQQLLADAARAGYPVERPALVALVAVMVGMAWPVGAGLNALLNFDLQMSAQRASFDELRQFADDYPHGMVGIAGRESYGLTHLRPWITARGTAQTDYGAWMDWNLSGVSDAPLAQALAACRIPYLFVPTGGEPFSMDNNYGTGPLFSDAVREGFGQHYLLVHPGQYFNVYGCTDSRTVRRAK